MFKRIVGAACVAGVVAGLLLTGVQALQVAPTIFEAEGYEASEPPPVAHTHAGGAAHDHGAAWAPGDGLERTFYTAVSNVVMATGFALILCAVYASRPTLNWMRGLGWGCAGFAVFFLNPALGLSPEVPGAHAADLVDRQVWWLLTVVCTAAGIGLMAFSRQWGLRAAGAALVVVPHLIGAPQPAEHGGLAPESLASDFVIAAFVANAVFWAALGVVSAEAYRRLA